MMLRRIGIGLRGIFNELETRIHFCSLCQADSARESFYFVQQLDGVWAVAVESWCEGCTPLSFTEDMN